MRTLQNFFKLEAASGILLFFAACAALIIENSSYSSLYQTLIHTTILNHDTLYYINNGLMVIFFLLISLELKRVIASEGLANIKNSLLPAFAALGGMIVPALIYTLVNYKNPQTLEGWAIPVATDIAFALGVLSLFGKKLPYSLKVFLMSLAIFDDLGAIIIIAAFHSHEIVILYIVLSILCFVLLCLLNFFRIRQLFFYVFLGIIFWFCVLKSGIHPTIAGVMLGLVMPLQNDMGVSPLQTLEDFLHPWVSFIILPIFAFANAGVSLLDVTLYSLFDYITLGIILGLFLGKQIGVFLFSWVLVKLGIVSLPQDVKWMQLYGVAMLCGIGFTMSLFLGTLTFSNTVQLDQVRLGVLIGSLFSGIGGSLILARDLTPSSRGLSAGSS